MSERELLELAAKGAGYEYEVFEQEAFWGIQLSISTGWWNPLHDDGDALRLAVGCSLDIFINQITVIVEYDGRNGFVTEDVSYDKPKAARLAIVRAAARLGSMRAS